MQRREGWKFGFCLILALALAQPAFGGDVTTAPMVSVGSGGFPVELRSRIERIVAGHHGVMGVSFHHLGRDERLSVNGAERFPAASTIKLAVMATAFDRLATGAGPFKNYYDTVTYTTASAVSGAGFLQNYKDGVKVELKELVHLMITVSDNTATNMLTEWIGGPAAVSAWLKARGFEATRMNATVGGKLKDDPALSAKWGIGVTTPDEMARLMEMIATGRAGTTTTTDEMLRVLAHQYFDGDIPAGSPPTVWTGSKSGAVNASRSDVATVATAGGTYVLAVYTKENADKSWGDSNEAELAIAAIARAIYRHYNPADTWTPPPGVEKF